MTLEQAMAWPLANHDDQFGFAAAHLRHAISYLDGYYNYNANPATLYSEAESEYLLTAWLHHLTGHTAYTIRASRRSPPRGD